MVELLIVLLIIGIMTAVAAPSLLDSMMIQRVESAARRIKEDMELARRDALAKSTTRVFDFINASTYVLEEINSLDHPGEEYSVDLSAVPFEIDEIIPDFSGFDNFAFSGYGLPTRGGQIKIRAGDHWRRIEVHDATGEVTIDAE